MSQQSTTDGTSSLVQTWIWLMKESDDAQIAEYASQCLIREFGTIEQVHRYINVSNQSSTTTN